MSLPQIKLFSRSAKLLELTRSREQYQLYRLAAHGDQKAETKLFLQFKRLEVLLLREE